ncbi:aquaporin-7-like [Spea bombifrons]|uniref:aquaporin-7-like n=1 Tax=Spea bombifrons TaxID=233779 RepID=UPI00234BFFC0|nr:aquaporin-7-like [Spea bombifrons]
MKTGKSIVRKIHGAISIRNRWAREALAELLATFVMMLFGLGAVAQVVLGKKQFGQYLSINLSFGFGVTMGIHVAGGVSGAHMNCAVSLTNCVLGRLPWRKLPVYVMAQMLGAFLAAAVVFCLYYEALNNYTGGNFTVSGPLATASIFATYPEPYLTIGGGFLDQVIGTGALLLCILAINDKKNSPALDGTHALLVGLLVTVIGMSMGMNSGYAINPARDLGPRVFTAMAGWGMEVFRAGNYWCWVPIVAPLVGGLTGAFLYQLLVALHHQPKEEDKKMHEMEKGNLENMASEYM